MSHVLTATNQELHREDREYIVFHRLLSKQTEMFTQIELYEYIVT
ncbi:MAG: hypothetical protein ACKPJO_23050 [Dolichospermum sp.]